MKLDITHRDKLIRLSSKPSRIDEDTNKEQAAMTTSATTTTVMPEIQPKLHLTSPQALKDGAEPSYGDFRDDLIRDGYAVIKNAIPRERADKYADAMYSWLEGLYVLLSIFELSQTTDRFE